MSSDSDDARRDGGGGRRFNAAQLAGLYALLAVVWIVASDMALNWWHDEPLMSAPGQLFKGIGFVLATAVLLWVLLRRHMRSLAASEARTQQTERMLSSVLSSLPGMAYRCLNDAEYTVLFASEGARELTGYDFGGGGSGQRGMTAIIDERDLPTVQAKVDEAVKAGRPFRITYRIRHARGGTRWVWEQGRAVSGGEIIEGFITDITEQTEAQEALRQSEKRYRMLIETALEGVVIINRSAEMLFVNPQFARMLGYSVGELVGRRVDEITLPECVEDLEERLKRRWEGESEQYETRYRRKDGQVVWAIITTNPIFDESGKVTGSLGMITDITKRVAAEDKLRESERRYRALADSRKLLLNELGHRVKNNLAGLHALLSMYARSARTVEDFAQFMRQKLVAMTTVHEMIAAANWEPIRLGDLIRHTSSQFRGMEMRELTIDAQGPPVTIPPRQVGPFIMILHELLTNSRKHGAYSREGGGITIRWDVRETQAGRRQLTLRWAEAGGPPIRNRPEPGLGLGLVEGFVRHELSGVFRYELAPDGFRGTLEGILDAVGSEKVVR